MEKQWRGIELANHLSRTLKIQVAELNQMAIQPKLAIVRVGTSPDDLYYERSAIKQAEKLGVVVEVHTFAETVSQTEIEQGIITLNQSTSVHGILLLRPLPTSLNEKKICNLIEVAKDIDGVTDRSLSGIFTNEPIGFSPCTSKACVEMLDFHKIDVTGKHVVIVGRSLVVGKPLSMLLLNRNATVTICHSWTRNLISLCQQADIVVAAVGQVGFLTEEYFSEKQIILDVGINVDETGKLVGDVLITDKLVQKIEAYTPVPGGIGAVTTSILMKHVISACLKQTASQQK